MLTYRVEQLEHAVKGIADTLRSINDNLKALTSLEARHANIEDSVRRSFERLEKVETTQRGLDGEFKKWFNRGVGAASLISIIWIAGSWYFINQVKEIAATVDKVVDVERRLVDAERKSKRNQKVLSIMAKKLGYEIDLVDSD